MSYHKKIGQLLSVIVRKKLSNKIDSMHYFLQHNNLTTQNIIKY